MLDNRCSAVPLLFVSRIIPARGRARGQCIAHGRPYAELASDLAANAVARYNFITPNVCDDMHDKCKGNAKYIAFPKLSKNSEKLMNAWERPSELSPYGLLSIVFWWPR